MQQPSRVVIHTQVAAELQRGDPGFGLADQVKGQKPGGQRQFGGLHDRASRERGLMAAVPTRIALEPPAIDEPTLMAIAAGTAEPVGPASLLQGYLTLLLGDVEPLELRQGKTFLELDRTAGHDQSGINVLLHSPRRCLAERAG